MRYDRTRCKPCMDIVSISMYHKAHELRSELSISCTSCMHLQSLYEELVQCTFPNNLSPGDTVGAVTFVQALEEHVGGDIEALCIRTIGIKNCDVPGVLSHKELPVEVTYWYSLPRGVQYTLPLSSMPYNAYDIRIALNASCVFTNPIVVHWESEEPETICG